MLAKSSEKTVVIINNDNFLPSFTSEKKIPPMLPKSY